VLGHGLAVQALRATAKPAAKVGLADNIMAAVPVIETPPHIAAAERAARELNAGYLTVILEGRYTDAFLAAAGADAPAIHRRGSAGDRKSARFRRHQCLHADLCARSRAARPATRCCRFRNRIRGWHRLGQFFGPEALYWAPRHLQKIWNVKEIYISENGCGTADAPDRRRRRL